MIRINNGRINLDLDYSEAETLVVEILKDSLNLVEYFVEEALTSGEITEAKLKDLEDNIVYKKALERVIEYFGG